MNELQRQGDLLFVPIPRGEKIERAKDHPGGGVLAHGEATGHSHAIAPADLAQCDVFLDATGRLIMSVKPTGTLVAVSHEEHGVNTFAPGRVEVRRQREYAPAGWYPVAD